MAGPRDRREGGALSDLRGAGRLLGAAVLGVTDVVEDMHRNIGRAAPVVGPSPTGRTRGITGLVYRSVRGVTEAVGPPAEAVLTTLAPLLDGYGSGSPRREAVVAALNGVYGDHLAATHNPLAIPMRLRRDGRALVLDKQALAASVAEPSDRLLVLVHGLCMNDLQWKRAAHDHGAALALEQGCTTVYLHYNSGRHVSENGREFAALLEQLIREWPVEVRELVIVGHSMGGLVTRSACHYALQADHAWPGKLESLVFLGTPHHGAPMERAGNRVNLFGELSPYTAPLARLGTLRSAGIKDLRHGSLVDEDWQGRDSGCPHDRRRPVPLPDGVRCFAVAADRDPPSVRAGWRPRGDGLVPVESALGRHTDASRALPIPSSNRHVVHGLDHFELLDSPDVYHRLQRWLAPDTL